LASPFAAIVLAAGASARFGSDKLGVSLTVAGKTAPLLAHSLRPWLEACGEVVVVSRPASEALRHAVESVLDGQGALRWIECGEAALGMGHSLAAGVAASASAAGWIVGLGDMPWLRAADIRAVRDALAGGAPLAACCHHGRRGHPVGFSAGYRTALLRLSGDAGARGLLGRDAAMLVSIEVPHDGVLRDVDTPQDLPK
jgi:molybdenum cofactor cytidylyltransferase